MNDGGRDRRSGAAKVTGEALYIDDMPFAGALHGKTVRTTVARGRLRGVRFLPGVPWEEFVVVTAADIPGRNVVALIEDDQPYLAHDVVRHVAEPVVLIAHADRGLVEKAARLVALDIEALPPVLTIDGSLAAAAAGDPQHGADNVFKRYRVARGDAAAAIERADVVVEGTYETGAQEQLYIEPQGVVAEASPEKGVTVWGSMQCPYYVHKALGPVLGLPPERIRVVQASTGGGFGGKEEYPNVIAGHAALLSWKAGGRPVKMVYDRLEDMWATTKRHPARTTIRSGFTRDGRLVGLHVSIDMDGGAYVTLTPVVLSRGTLHAGGAYRCEDVTIDARAILTNAPPYGAFRGFGAPQTIFAIEMHMERAARALGIDPVELRRRNFLRAGDTLPTGQRLGEDPGLGAMLDEALAALGPRPATEPGGPWRGRGVSTFFHGSGFTGSGEVRLASRAALEIADDGMIRVLAASTDIGQGTIRVFTRIVADRLCLPYGAVSVVPPDTALVPDSGPTVASRTTMVVGRLLERAADELRQAVTSWYAPAEDEPFGTRGFLGAAAAYVKAGQKRRFECQYEPPPGVHWDDATYTGDAYAAYAWSVHAVDVAVDPLTFQAEVTDFVAVQEVGRVLEPTLAAGQIEGGVAQGIGWALYEDVVLRDGAMANHQLTNYILPTAADTVPIRTIFHESPYAHGPQGAKGIGELPMDGPAPAIGAALADALGVVVPRIPFLPERLMDAVDAAKEATR